MDDSDILICPSCEEEVDEIFTDNDPFAMEVYQEEVEMTACVDCFRQRREDI